MINIAELLKDVPKGWKLYSPLFGEVNFVGVDKQSAYPINVTDCKGNGKSFTEFGVYFAEHPDAECLLFPSKDCRTWEGWKTTDEPNFKVGDWIVGNEGIFKITQYEEEYGYYLTDTTGRVAHFVSPDYVESNFHLWTIDDAKDGDMLTDGKLIVIFNKFEEPSYKQHIIAHIGLDLCGRLQITEDTWQLGIDKAMPATKEQRDLLFAKIKEAGYEWDAEKKELRKIKPHYDISNFQPFDKVLVRCGNDEEWMIEFYCKYDTLVHTSPHRDYPFMGIGDSYSQCVPFNDKTKHLLGTTDMCDECYINW